MWRRRRASLLLWILFCFRSRAQRVLTGSGYVCWFASALRRPSCAPYTELLLYACADAAEGLSPAAAAPTSVPAARIGVVSVVHIDISSYRSDLLELCVMCVLCVLWSLPVLGSARRPTSVGANLSSPPATSRQYVQRSSAGSFGVCIRWRSHGQWLCRSCARAPSCPAVQLSSPCDGLLWGALRARRR